MAIQHSFKIEGFDALTAALNDMKEEIGKQKTDKIWREAVTRGAEPILAAVKAAAPQDTGQLKDRIYMKVRRPKARDKSGKFYAGEEYMARIIASPLRDESYRHFIVNKKGRLQSVWRNKKPVAISQEYGNARVPAKPFLRPGLNNAANSAVQIVKMFLSIKINEYVRARNRAWAAKG
jgi:HK97 gp10 family phage protein